MWCILCCQTRTNEDKRCSKPENSLPVELRELDSSERVALIAPINKAVTNASCETSNVDTSNVCTGGCSLPKRPMEDNHLIKADEENSRLIKNNPLTPVKAETAKTVLSINTTKTYGLNNTSPDLPKSLKNSSPTQRSHRSEGMSVSFNTPLERAEENERPRSQPSATGRPIWTLKDVLDSPCRYEPTTDGKPDELIISITDSQSNQTQTKTTNSTEQTINQTNDTSNDNRVHLSRRHTRPGSLYHPHATFFLPRISTDPMAGHNTFDHIYATDGKTFPIRRGSMIVRSGRTTTSSTNVQASATDQSSIGAPGTGVEGFIVTPFAQVLVSMQRIRSAFIRLTSTQSTNRYGVIASTVSEPGIADILVPQTDEYRTVASETLEELEWCLKQLETIQTKRPVSDMAFSKFKRLLNKELNSFGEADKSRHEISAYICGTFLEDEKDAQANQEIEQMLERRRSSGQSHGSSGTTQDNQISTTGGKLQSTQQQQQVQQQRSSLLSPETGSVKPTEKVADNHTAGASQTGLSGKTATKTSTDSSVNLQPDRKLSAGDQTQDSQLNETQTELPMHGIKTSNDKELDDRFNQYLDTWGIDIFEVDRLSDGHGLVTTTYRIFQKRDLMRIFSIDPATLVRYLLKVEQNYHPDVPYHNSLHATDVIQTSHYLLQAEPLEDVFSDLEILAVLFASAVHDVDHPGLTNQYLINTGHDLALQYNDTSVLENHHLYVAFKLLNEPDCDVFSSLTAKKRQTLRRMVIELVLATDMSKHMSLLADLRTMVETKKVSGSGVLNLDNYSDRIQILQNMIHCADLSNPAKPLRLNRKWTGRLMEEFFRQGDKERMLKLEISPMCDRESVAVEKSQVTFIDFVAHPLLESWCDLVHPSAQLILDTLADNRDWYESQTEDPRPSGVTKCRPKLATAEEDEEEQATSS